MKAVLKQLFPTKRFYLFLSALAGLFVLGFFYPWLFLPAKIALVAFLVSFISDVILLFRFRKPISGTRITPERLSNGDRNKISLFLKSTYPFPVNLELRDLTPVQFQLRNLRTSFTIKSGSEKRVDYFVEPVSRGEYHFGNILVFVTTHLGLAERKITLPADSNVPVYPSYVQMKKFELMAISSNLTLQGIKKVRKRGQQSEFEHIREYALGDDIRTLNWKATARRQRLMVNQHMDERAQQVYNIIDLGRAMKMPFNGMTLVDYAINSSLALSNIILKKHDRAGIITYGERVKNFIPAERRNHQLSRIMNLLYNQTTSFPESSPAMLYSFLRYNVTQRSLLFIYTNFETLQTIKREIRFFGRIAKFHLPVVVIFENTELQELTESSPSNTEEIYQKVIGEKLSFEKKQIVKELQQNGVQTILTPPDKLSVNSINKYLELKSRGLV